MTENWIIPRLKSRAGRFLPALAFSLFALLLVGYVALVVGAGSSATTYSYVKGQLEQDYPVGLDKTYNASIAALERLELVLIDRNKDKLGATIKARRTDDTKITVKLSARGDENTHVAIRVGTFGDQDVSRRIDDEIRRALGR